MSNCTIYSTLALTSGFCVPNPTHPALTTLAQLKNFPQWPLQLPWFCNLLQAVLRSLGWRDYRILSHTKASSFTHTLQPRNTFSQSRKNCDLLTKVALRHSFLIAITQPSLVTFLHRCCNSRHHLMNSFCKLCSRRLLTHLIGIITNFMNQCSRHGSPPPKILISHQLNTPQMHCAIIWHRQSLQFFLQSYCY